MRLPFLKQCPKQIARYGKYQEGDFYKDLTDFRNNYRYKVIEEDTYFHKDKNGRITFYYK